MTTNAEITQFFFESVDGAALGLPIAYPSIKFTPPDAGNWLELSFMPNTGIDQGLQSDRTIKQGLLQINIGGKPNGGLIPLQIISDTVAAIFPKNSILVDLVRISRSPYTTDIISLDDRQLLPLTIMYSE
tara:strand:+ start:700 stop:1089 length:390 start_codon:yes stop_codon:yes gene_type:complete